MYVSTGSSDRAAWEAPSVVTVPSNQFLEVTSSARAATLTLYSVPGESASSEKEVFCVTSMATMSFWLPTMVVTSYLYSSAPSTADHCAVNDEVVTAEKVTAGAESSPSPGVSGLPPGGSGPAGLVHAARARAAAARINVFFISVSV